MSRKLIIDGNAVYEIDEKCMLKKKLGELKEKKRNKTAKAKRVILILFKMFPKDIFGHFHHAVNLILFFFAFTFF